MKSITLRLVFLVLSARLVVVILITFFDVPAIYVYPKPWILIILVTYLILIFYIDVCRPLIKIERTMDNYANGAFESRIQTRRKDEVGRIATNFNKLADRVQGMIQTERRMGANLAHELRLPLARMALLSDLIVKCPEESGNIELLKREIMSLSELSNSLLRLAQYERTEFAIQAEVFPVDQFIQKIVSLFQVTAASKNCFFHIEVADGLTLFTDKSLLQIAISNLIDNAIHYTDPDTTISVKAFVDQPNHLVRILVRDHGSGVPPEFLERILLPFERVDYSRNQGTGGVGLGLSIVRSIVKCLNGTIHLENQNPGLQVEIQLPDSVVEPPQV
jgi:two-component system sensor histidine kinase CpxA